MILGIIFLLLSIVFSLACAAFWVLSIFLIEDHERLWQNTIFCFVMAFTSLLFIPFFIWAWVVVYL